MTVATPTGPPVADCEELYRCLMYQKWWNADENRVSSAAFNFPRFSVDVASISGSEENTLAPFLPGTGLVVFNCGKAREQGCQTHLEPDEQRLDNKAHAHVYLPPSSGQRKRAVQHLIKICTVLRKPNLETQT
jgi:hypothetical protein